MTEAEMVGWHHYSMDMGLSEFSWSAVALQCCVNFCRAAQ